MLELLLAASGRSTETQIQNLTDRWDEHDGFRLDSAGCVEASVEPPFPTADAESVLLSYLRSSPDPIFIVDNTGEFVYSNTECRELFDREPGELIGTNLFEYDNADNSAMQNVLDNGEPLLGLSESIVTDNGKNISVERFLYPLHDTEGKLIGGIEINRDVSARVSAQRREEQLEQLRAYQSQVADRFDEWLAALGRGDYTIDPEIPEPDAEFDDAREVYNSFKSMAKSLDEVVDNANGMLGDVDDGTQKLDQLGERLSAVAGETATATERIDESSDEVAAAAKSQLKQATEAEQSTANLSASVEEITATTEEISSQAARAHELADDGMVAAETAADRMSTAVDSSETNVSHVRELQDQMDDVRDMTDRIADIAEQTNLLALNASIEAARTDGNSDGFAVVATEIEELADETRTTVGEISETLADLGSDVEDTATAIERSNEKVKNSAEAVETVLEHLSAIDEAVAETDEGVSQIASATDDQAANAQTVQTAAENLTAESETVEERVADISARVDEQTDTVHRVQMVAEDISDISEQLRSDLTAFDLKHQH